MYALALSFWHINANFSNKNMRYDDAKFLEMYFHFLWAIYWYLIV